MTHSAATIVPNAHMMRWSAHVVDALRDALACDGAPRTIVVTGARGCGKSHAVERALVECAVERVVRFECDTMATRATRERALVEARYALRSSASLALVIDAFDEYTSRAFALDLHSTLQRRQRGGAALVVASSAPDDAKRFAGAAHVRASEASPSELAAMIVAAASSTDVDHALVHSIADECAPDVRRALAQLAVASSGASSSVAKRPIDVAHALVERRPFDAAADTDAVLALLASTSTRVANGGDDALNNSARIADAVAVADVLCARHDALRPLPLAYAGGVAAASRARAEHVTRAFVSHAPRVGVRRHVRRARFGCSAPEPSPDEARHVAPSLLERAPALRAHVARAIERDAVRWLVRLGYTQHSDVVDLYRATCFGSDARRAPPLTRRLSNALASHAKYAPAPPPAAASEARKRTHEQAAADEQREKKAPRTVSRTHSRARSAPRTSTLVPID